MDLNNLNIFKRQIERYFDIYKFIAQLIIKIS